MYKVKDASGETVAICSRLEDAEAMCQTVGKQIRRFIEKVG
jgi:type IV secretory pathway TrbF-like protein